MKNPELSGKSLQSLCKNNRCQISQSAPAKPSTTPNNRKGVSMKNNRSLLSVLLVVFAFLLFFSIDEVSARAIEPQAEGSILFVNSGANGTCASWEDACELQTALYNAVAGDEIWVAAGTYKPTTSSDRTKTFQLKSGVAIYGGFPAAGGMWEERDWILHETVLSGDIGLPGVDTDNSYHVVMGSNVDSSAILNGFRISDGYANDNRPNHFGGGLYNENSNPTLSQLIFSGNYGDYGGGILNSTNSHPRIYDVTFDSNTAAAGGGMYNIYSSNPTLVNVTFSNNSANSGGGMHNDGSSPSLFNVTFYENSASYWGGGIGNQYGSNPYLENVTFFGNSISYTGGGGIYSEYDSNPTLTNAIVWGNTPDQIAGDPAYVSYSIIEGGYTGEGNISGDPLLGPLADNGGFTDTMALLANSPAIDSGNPNVCPIIDQRVYARPIDGDSNGTAICDIGAYEYGSTPTLLPLAVNLVGNGVVVKDPDKTEYDWGEVVTLTAIPESGWSFAGWSGDVNGTNNQVTLTMNMVRTPEVTAFFTQNENTLMVSVNPIDVGSVAKSPSKPYYNYGEIVTLTPIAIPGWTFTGWSGDATGAAVPLMWTMQTDTTIIANFSQDEYYLNVSLNPSNAGILSIEPIQDMYHYGDLVSISIIPNPGLAFTGWSGDVIDSNPSITVIISGDTNISANFLSPEMAILYVKPDSDGNCSTWDDACDLQTALDQAVPGTMIWVAEGIYTPTASVDRTISFLLKSGVAIYGGFPSEGGSWVDRNWETNITTLSGDIGIADDNWDNSYHVVKGYDIDNTSILDGFTISGGNADGTYPHNYGGGMLNDTASPSLANIIFSTNHGVFGGGMSNIFSSNPTMKDIVFTDNSAVEYGGGIYNKYSSNPTLTDMLFINNSASRGGGITNENDCSPNLLRVDFNGNQASAVGGGMWNFNNGNPTLVDVTFSNNHSPNAAGGMGNEGSGPTLLRVAFIGNSAGNSGGAIGNTYCGSTQCPSYTNVTISGNTSGQVGGGISNHYSRPTFDNVTVFGNNAYYNGGGIYNEYNSFPKMQNSIIWGNNPDPVYSTGSIMTITYSLLDRPFDGEGNLFVNPQLEPLFENGGLTLVHALPISSSAIDAGNPDLTTCSQFDQRGLPRPADGDGDGNPRCDMGAFERQPYSLIVDVNGAGEVILSPNQSDFYYSQDITLTAVPDPGWTFSGWSGDATGLTNPLTVTIANNTNITASFTQDEYNLAIAIDPQSMGSITVTPLQDTYHYGDQVTLSATAIPGWSFSSWSGDATGTSNPLIVTVEGNTNITANFIQDEYTLVTAVDPSGMGSVSVTPLQDIYHYGDVVTLTATPIPGWSFSGWSGDAISTTNPLTVTIAGNTSITAIFTQDEYTLSVSVDPLGKGSVAIEPEQTTYHYGDQITLTPSANPGWTFASWGGNASGSDNPLTYTIVGNTSITATFTQDEYSLTVTPVGSGTVAIEPVKATYHYGDQITLTPSANPGWTFTGWSGDASGTDNPLTIIIEGDTNITANFTNQYALIVDVNPSGSGTVTLDPEQATFQYGSQVTLTPIASSGWYFLGWSGDSNSADNPLVITIEGDTSITANFAEFELIYLPMVLRN